MGKNFSSEIEAELKNHTSSTTQVNNVEDKIPGTKCVVTMQEILLPNEKYEYIEALAETDYYYCLNHPSKNDCSPLPETPILGLSLFFIKALNSTEAQEYCSHHQDYGEL